MAKLSQLPELAIISGFKGILDFYVHKGIPCCRSWPVHKPRERSTAEKANQDAFAYAIKLSAQASPAIRQAHLDFVKGYPYTWRDYFVKAYMSGIHREMGAP